MGIVATFQCYNLIGPDSHRELPVFRWIPQDIEPSSWLKCVVARDGGKRFLGEHDDKCRQSSKTRRSVDAYPDFQFVIQTHRLLAGVVV